MDNRILLTIIEKFKGAVGLTTMPLLLARRLKQLKKFMNLFLSRKLLETHLTRTRSRRASV